MTSTGLRPGSMPRVSSVQRAFAERTRKSLTRRRVMNVVMGGLTIGAAVIATLPLIFILTHIVINGARSIDLNFFFKTPAPLGQTGGGLANGMVGTLVVVATAIVVGLPVGIGAGLFLAEKREGPLATPVRFLSDVLNGMPSIVMGIFIWHVIVKPTGRFTAFAGGIALAVILIPLVTRTTEEMVRTVPVSLREAALALGYSHWRTSLSVVLRTSLAGIVTGVLVAVARIAGETAPVLFTVHGSNYVSVALNQPIQVLTLQIYVYATSGFEEWTRLAWAGSLVLVAFVLAISVAARLATRSRFRSGTD